MRRALALLVAAAALGWTAAPRAAVIAEREARRGTGPIETGVPRPGEPDAEPPALQEVRAGVAALVALPGPVDPAAYVVGPGDVLELVLSGGVSETVPLVVGPEGAVVVPGFGTAAVAGLTLERAREAVGRLVRGSLRGGVGWDVRLARVRLMRVYVTGEVRRPGAVDLPATSRVSDALPEDRLLDGASRRNVLVRHRDGAETVADLERFSRLGDVARNPFLRDGDVVNVPKAVEWIEVQGAVARPGRYELGPDDSLRTLIDLAGGPLPATLTDGALLLRWPGPTEADSVKFSLLDVYEGTFNPPLREGERVYVYFTPSYHESFQATVIGEVERPGSYPITLGHTRLSDMVRAAGGFRARADLSTIRLYRASLISADKDIELDRLSRLARSEMTESEYEQLRTRLTARREDYRVDWARLAQQPELDLLLDHNDVIRVDPVLPVVRVEGEVRRPGLMEFDARLGVSDYVRLAGGYTKRAARTKVLVMRSVTGQTLPIRDVPSLAPGDMVWVPVRPDRTVWESLQTLLVVGAQVATIWIAVDATRN